jgi:hypothetical protein
MSAPTGWYPNPNDPGRLRYWDGTRWAYGDAGGGPPTPPSGKPRSRSPWLIPGLVIAAVVLLGGGMVAGALLVGGNADDDAAGGATTTSVEVTTTTDTADEQAAEGQAEEAAEPVGLEPVEDDSGSLTVMVPASWTDVDGRPFEDGTHDVVASTDIDEFYRSFDTSGIDFIAFRTGSSGAGQFFDPTDPIAMEDSLWVMSRFAGDRPDIPDNACESVDREEFAEAGFDGVIDIYSDCGETGSTYVTVAAADPEETTGISVEMVLAEPGERAALDGILDSLTANLLG